MAEIVLSQDNARHRYEAAVGGVLAGFCEYKAMEGALMFTHTEVLPEYEGQGVGSALAQHALDDARKQGRKVVPACQFIAEYIRRHPKYADLVSQDSGS